MDSRAQAAGKSTRAVLTHTEGQHHARRRMANLGEGSRRIKIAGLLTMLVCAILFASFFLPFRQLEFFHDLVMNPNYLRTAVTAGAFLWALGWILQGFASRE